jgi:tyrosine-protein phosphatase non-receptor type 12/18/22
VDEFEFTQYHITDWPDHGVPADVESIIFILEIVRERLNANNINLQKNKNVKIPLCNEYLVVHCSAGCGRTGTIIAIDQVWNLMNENVIRLFYLLIRFI